MGFSLDRVSVVHANGGVALDDVSLSVAPGERVGLIGHSGAGKTTLLRLACTDLRASSGTVRVLDVEPSRLRGRQLRHLRGRIGMVYQAPPIPPRQRVVTAVLAGRIGSWPLWKSAVSLARPVDIEGATASLERVDIAEKLFERCGNLSGGQLQRVGIARLLYQAPELLLADEPVSAVDPALSGRIIAEMSGDAARRGKTLVASLHAVDLALRWFPRIVGMRQGRIAFDLPAERVDKRMLDELYA